MKANILLYIYDNKQGSVLNHYRSRFLSSATPPGSVDRYILILVLSVLFIGLLKE